MYILIGLIAYEPACAAQEGSTIYATLWLWWMQTQIRQLTHQIGEIRPAFPLLVVYLVMVVLIRLISLPVIVLCRSLALDLFVILLLSVVHRSQSLGHAHWLHDVAALEEDLVDLFEVTADGLGEEEVDGCSRVSIPGWKWCDGNDLLGSIKHRLIQA